MFGSSKNHDLPILSNAWRRLGREYLPWAALSAALAGVGCAQGPDVTVPSGPPMASWKQSLGPEAKTQAPADKPTRESSNGQGIQPVVYLPGAEQTGMPTSNGHEVPTVLTEVCDLTSLEASCAAEAGLTLDAVIKLAYQNNPTLGQAGAMVDEAKGNWLQAGLYPNPVVGYEGEEINDDGTAGQQGLFVSQTVVTAGKRRLSRATASWEIERTRLQADAQRWAVLNAVRTQFYRVLATQRMVSVAQDLEKLLDQGVKNARDLFKAEQVPETDVLQAEIERDRVRLARQQAEFQLNAARQQLSAVVGVPCLPTQSLVGQLAVTPPTIDDCLLENMLKGHPVLRAAESAVRRAQAMVDRQRVQPIPDLLLEGGVAQDTNEDQVLASARVGIELPVFNRNQGNIASSTAQLRTAQANVRRLELVYRQRWAQVYRQFRAAQAQSEFFRDSLVPKAKRTLDLINKGYQSGEVGFLAVLTARRTYTETQMGYINALSDLATSVVQLDGLLITGGLSLPTQTTQMGNPSNAPASTGLGPLPGVPVMASP